MVSYSIFLYKNPSQAALPLPSPFGEGNPEGEYLHVQASGFRDIKFPAVIFRPKKRSGIAVRVAEMSGTWQAKRPTTHNTRSIKKFRREIFCLIIISQRGTPSGVFQTKSSSCPIRRRLKRGTRASLAPNSAYYSFSFAGFVSPM